MAETISSTPTQPQLPASGTRSSFASPRVVIRFCTQCKWMLRAAYFAQELLSTFSTSLGEVALQPETGGVFVVEIYHHDAETTTSSSTASTSTNVDNPAAIQKRVLWDRKIDGGFPETKELKRRVRDVIEPDRNLGHVDRDYPRQPQQQQQQQQQAQLDNKETSGELNNSHENAMPESEQKQPLGPRWPQANKSEPLQASAERQNNTADSQTQLSTDENAQDKLRSVNSLRPHNQERNTSKDEPVYDPRMPAGGVKPVIPPVALRGGAQIQESRSPTESQAQSQSNLRECEDCQ